MFAPEFEEALWSLEKEGSISQPVKTEFGYHIIRLDSLQEVDYPGLEESRGDLIATLKEELARELFTEKMLEPARSEDWTVYETWKPITEELWAKVETQRRVRGLDEVPFEMLLRIMSEEQMTDETQTLQGLLSDDRIW